MAAAYLFAEGDGPKPYELQILEAIDRFGVEAITGRKTLRPGFVRRAVLMERVVDGYRARARSNDWDVFSSHNPELSELLIEAARCANDERS